jgi:hypothetical protein
MQGDIPIAGPANIQIQQPQEVAPAAAEGQIMFVGTDGKKYNVPASSYEMAVKEGWKPWSRADEIRENTIKHRVDETSQFAGGANTFTNEALFGIPDYIRNKNLSPERAALEEEVSKRVAERDPITHAVSAGAGFVAPMLIPGVGELGAGARGAVLGERALARGAEEVALKAVAEQTVAKAAESGLARKMAATVADYAVQGAVYSAPKAAVQVAYGDVEQAAETMAVGIGLSAVLGAGVGGITASMKGAAKLGGGAVDSLSAKLTEKQANGITYADDLARNLHGFTDKQAQRLGPETITKMMERSDQIGMMQSGKIMKFAEGLEARSGKAINEHLDNLEKYLSDPEIKKLVTSPMDVSNEFQQLAMKKFPEMMMETHASQLKEFNKIVKDIGSGGTEPSFLELQKIRTGLKSGKKAFEKNTPQAEMYRVADGVIQKNLETSAQQVYTAGEAPEKFASYLQDKFDFRLAKETLFNKNEFKGTGRIPSLEALIGPGSSVINAGMAAMSGHPGVAGLAIGAKYAIKKLLANEAFLGKGISTLRGIAKDPASTPIIGGLLAKEGQSALSRHLDTIPELLTAVKPSKIAAITAVNATTKFLGDEAIGLSKDQQFQRTSDHITRLMMETDNTSDKVGHIASAFSGTSIQLASLVAQKKLNAIAYLHSQLPKNPQGPQPFQKDDWKPNKQDQIIFNRKLAIVMDPMQVWRHIQDHSVTQADVDTLKAVYPKIYEAMVEKTLNAAYDPRTGSVSHGTRMAVSTFTGAPLDQSIKNIANIQAAIKSPQAGQSAGQIKKPSKAPKFDRSPTLTTDVQRRTYGKEK